MKFSSVRAVVNKIMSIVIDKAANFNEEELAKIHEKSKKIVPDFSVVN